MSSRYKEEIYVAGMPLVRMEVEEGMIEKSENSDGWGKGKRLMGLKKTEDSDLCRI